MKIVGFFGSVLGIYLVVYGGFVALVALWSDRTLDFWISYFKHSPVDVPYWVAYLGTFFLPGVSWIANIASEIGRFCV